LIFAIHKSGLPPTGEARLSAPPLQTDALVHLVLASPHVLDELPGQFAPVHDARRPGTEVAEVGDELLWADHAERFGPHVEQDQPLGVVSFVQPGERVRPEKLREDLEAGKTGEVWVVPEHALDGVGERGPEHVNALAQMSVSLDELFESRLGQVETFGVS
jgi:hypothetical protein